ncbi:hypothetical protein MAR_006671 [Mya arenaria]|uniref:Uncharacterized protein n=1 Tax=Mya arenaria TaxID=6604 RepID=A0ABY7DBX5_MYAAR|nr:hypothetical protein MAR_006671 [Mya arenaria]
MLRLTLIVVFGVAIYMGEKQGPPSQCANIRCLTPACSDGTLVKVQGKCCPICIGKDPCIFGGDELCQGIAGFQCAADSGTKNDNPCEPACEGNFYIDSRKLTKLECQGGP